MLQKSTLNHREKILVAESFRLVRFPPSDFHMHTPKTVHVAALMIQLEGTRWCRRDKKDMLFAHESLMPGVEKINPLRIDNSNDNHRDNSN